MSTGDGLCQTSENFERMRRYAAYIIVALLTFLIGSGVSLLYLVATHPCGPQPTAQKKVTRYVTAHFTLRVF